jgi:flavodoxin
MKALVAYLSNSGNTRKVAEAIFEGITDCKEIKPLDEVNSLEGYDIAFLGFPVHQGGPDKKAAKILQKHCINGRKIALFITHASQENSPGTLSALAQFREAAGASLIDMFDCQGQLSRVVKILMSVYPETKYRQWAKADNSHGQPDQSRLDRARVFSRNVMQKLHENEVNQSQSYAREMRLQPLAGMRTG